MVGVSFHSASPILYVSHFDGVKATLIYKDCGTGHEKVTFPKVELNFSNTFIKIQLNFSKVYK